MSKPDMKTLNVFRGIFHEANKKWCPEESKRLKMFVEEHFIERLFERFTNNVEAGELVKNTMKWIKKNYPVLQYEDTFGTKREYCITMEDGNVAVMILFSGTLRMRTCYKPTEGQYYD